VNFVIILVMMDINGMKNVNKKNLRIITYFYIKQMHKN